MEEFCGDLPQVSAEANSQLERPLQLEKLHAALQSVQGWRDSEAIVLPKACYTSAPKFLQDFKIWHLVSLKITKFCLRLWLTG